MCIYDFLKENDFKPFPRAHIQLFAKQLLSSVACEFITTSFCIRLVTDPGLVLHDLHLVHTDLKPENILLVDSDARIITETIPGGPGRVSTRSLF